MWQKKICIVCMHGHACACGYVHGRARAAKRARESWQVSIVRLLSGLSVPKDPTQQQEPWRQRASETGRRLKWMLFTVQGLNLPSAMSGPSTRLLPAWILPDLRVPATTVPTPGTANASLMTKCGAPCTLSSLHVEGGTGVGWPAQGWAGRHRDGLGRAREPCSLHQSRHCLALAVQTVQPRCRHGFLG